MHVNNKWRKYIIILENFVELIWLVATLEHDLYRHLVAKRGQMFRNTIGFSAEKKPYFFQLGAIHDFNTILLFPVHTGVEVVFFSPFCHQHNIKSNGVFWWLKEFQGDRSKIWSFVDFRWTQIKKQCWSISYGNKWSCQVNQKLLLV